MRVRFAGGCADCALRLGNGGWGRDGEVWLSYKDGESHNAGGWPQAVCPDAGKPGTLHVQIGHSGPSETHQRLLMRLNSWV